MRAGVLSVDFDGKARVHNLTVPLWAPTAGWRFGIGARTSAAVDEHLLGAVTVETGALVDDEAVAVELTLNGQQFSDSGREYTFYSPSHVSAFSPTSGPIAGQTSLVVHGAHFKEGWEYRCRFGNATVNATFVSDERLACTAAPAHITGQHALEVSIDKYNFKDDAVQYLYYSVPVVSGITPTGGPTSGQTQVVLRGSDFTGGSDYRCKFGTRIVRATLGSSGKLTCVSPAQGMAGAVHVEVAMNGQQFSSGAMEYTFFAPPRVSAFSPTSGPVTGETRVVVHGAHFREGNFYLWKEQP